MLKKGMCVVEIYIFEILKEIYGFFYELFIDFKVLVGDKFDNILGVLGVGEVIVKKLIVEYGMLENILNNVEYIKGKFGENICINKE